MERCFRQKTAGTVTAVAVAVAALFLSGCYGSHDDGDAAAMPPPPPPPPPPGGDYEVGPAPGEGPLCPELPPPPPGCATGGTGYCDAAELQRELFAATPGDVVQVGRCRVSASLVVPLGVTLAGVDREASVLVALSGQPAIVLSAEASPSVARCLTVEANAAFGILAQGAGEARVEHVTIRAETGGGIEADGVGRLALHHLDVIGPVTFENSIMQALTPTPEETGTFGLALVQVGQVTIYGTRVTGFAASGVLIGNSAVTLRAVDLARNMGVGGYFTGSLVCARSLSSAALPTGRRLLPPYGLAVVDGSEFHGADVSVTESEGYGILQDDSALAIEGLVIESNSNAAFWQQNGGEVVIRDARIVDNGTTGVHACNASMVSIADSEISHTRAMIRVVGSMPVELGAGIAVGRVENVHLTNLRLEDNETVGLILDFGAVITAEIEGVHVSGTGHAFGAVAFDEFGWMGLGGWDEGITREGSVELNDMLGGPGLPDGEGFGCREPGP